MVSLIEVSDTSTIVSFENPTKEEEIILNALRAYSNGHEIKLEMQLPDVPDKKSIYYFNSNKTKEEVAKVRSRHRKLDD